METIYFYSAVVGGAFLVIQTLLLVFAGAGGVDADAAHAADASDAGGFEHAADGGDVFFKVLSLKTLVGFAAFFGITGLAGLAAGWSGGASLAAAIGAGLLAVYVVAWLMAALHRLQSTGNLNLRNAVGKHGKVYLRVPGDRSGVGRVTLSVQGRMVECKAITAGGEIPTGAPIRVVSVDAADTLEVEPLSV